MKRWQFGIISSIVMLFYIPMDYQLFEQDCGSCCDDLYILWTWADGYGPVLNDVGILWLIVILVIIILSIVDGLRTRT